MTTLRPLLFILVAVVTGFHAPDGVAAKAKKWEKLSACHYVEDKNNDGDSFRVKCGEKDFVLRLYFVDAPETVRGDDASTE